MRILILGGDGYLGWPTAMNLSELGHEVHVADNYLRRHICLQENVLPLFPVPSLIERIRIWKETTGKIIIPWIGDLANWDFTDEIFKEIKPDVVIHYAEQPSAPYSMLNRRAATLTLKNNLDVTMNVIFAVKEHCENAHIVKLGTMGEYGTPNIDIEEGWIDIEHAGRKDRFLYPRQASSLYHTTKIMDTDLLWFYVRMWNLKVTDLMQGPVYGFFSNENENNQLLFPFFNYDELFGTVLNRFIVQAVIGYPLTVYGKGGQTRGYLDLRDTLQCVKLSVEHPPEPGELRIFNQFVQTFSVNDLASQVKNVGKELGIAVEVNHLPNPRKELEEHYYNPKHQGLIELGLEPHYLTDNVLGEMMEVVLVHKHAINDKIIFKGVRWADK